MEAHQDSVMKRDDGRCPGLLDQQTDGRYQRIFQIIGKRRVDILEFGSAGFFGQHGKDALQY